MADEDYAWKLAGAVAEPRASYGSGTLERARHAIVDTLACIIAGATDPAMERLLPLLASYGSGGALIYGSGARAAAPWAALALGTAAHAQDFDDSASESNSHASAVLLGAILPLAQEKGASGADVVDAYIIGLDILGGLGRVVNPRHYAAGWHATSTIGTIAAAAACARLLGLEQAGCLAAMSNAASMAGGSKRQFGSAMKAIHAGLAAQHGVMAAGMAQAGIAGDADPFGGAWGFFALHAAELSEEQAGATLAELEEGHWIDRRGTSVKRFPCCAASHRTLDGVLALCSTHGIQPGEVARVETWLPPVFRENLRFDRPRTVMEARFSLTYCGARVLDQGRLTLGDLTDQSLAAYGSEASLARIVPHRDESLTGEASGHFVRTDLILHSGARYSTAVRDVRGSPAAPLSVEDMRAKFLDCSAYTGMPNSDALLEAVWSVPELPDVRRLSATFAAAPRQPARAAAE